MKYAIVEWNGNGYTGLATAKTLDSAIMKALSMARAANTVCGPYRIMRNNTFVAAIIRHTNNLFEVSYN